MMVRYSILWIKMWCVCVCIYIYIHTHTYVSYSVEYYSVVKKNEIMPLAATWIDTEIIKVSKESQKEKDKYYMISLICGL